MSSRFSTIKKCCKPLSSKKCSRFLRAVQGWKFEKCPSIRRGDYICDSCRNGLHKTPTAEIPYDEAQDAKDDTYRSSDTVFEALNSFLARIDEPPVAKKDLRLQEYASAKFSQIQELLKTHVFNAIPSEENDNDTIIKQLKAKFRNLTDRNKKISLLTLIPKSWPTSRILKEFQGLFRINRQI